MQIVWKSYATKRLDIIFNIRDDPTSNFLYYIKTLYNYIIITYILLLHSYIINFIGPIIYYIVILYSTT